MRMAFWCAKGARTAMMVLALLLPAVGQPNPPVEAEGSPPMYVLVTDSDGLWSPEQQEHFQAPGALGEDGSVSTDWRRLLDTRPMRLLSFTDRVKLLRHPRRLLSSSWAAQYFQARHVMVLEPSEDGRVTGRLFDLETGDEDSVVVAGRPGKGKDTRAEALSHAAEMAEVAASPVLINPQSGIYHAMDAPHLSPRINYTRLPSAQRAEIHGLRPCRICFPESDRGQYYDDIDKKLGAYVAQSIEGRYRVAAEGPQTARVATIGQRVLDENRFLDRGYRFIVLDTDTINAYAAPTGPIYVTTGMLDILESDDELAAVLGHELSHSERHHARKQYEHSKQAGVVGLLVTVATGIPFARLGSDIVATILFSGYSRGYELEADRDGMMMAYAAGFVPSDFLLVQEKLRQLAEQSTSGGPGWLRTHPRGEERLQQLDKILKETGPMRARLDELDQKDHGLARHLKSRVLEDIDRQSETEDFLSLYEKVLARVERPQPPAAEQDDPLWEVLDNIWQSEAEIVDVVGE